MPDIKSIKLLTDLPVPMRDGTILYGDLYMPDAPGSFPTIIQRTPYDKTSVLSNQMLDPVKAAKSGYIYMIQDTRGRYTSEGHFTAFFREADAWYSMDDLDPSARVHELPSCPTQFPYVCFLDRVGEPEAPLTIFSAES